MITHFLQTPYFFKKKMGWEFIKKFFWGLFGIILTLAAMSSVISIIRRECKTFSLEGFQTADYDKAFSIVLLFGSAFYLYDYRPHFSYQYMYKVCTFIIGLNNCMDMFCGSGFR